MTDHTAWRIPTLQQLVATIDGGDRLADADAAYKQIVEEIEGRRVNGELGARGEITIKLGFKTMPKRTEVTMTVDFKLPKRPASKQEFYVTDDNLLTLRQPNQHDLEDLPQFRRG